MTHSDSDTQTHSDSDGARRGEYVWPEDGHGTREYCFVRATWETDHGDGTRQDVFQCSGFGRAWSGGDVPLMTRAQIQTVIDSGILDDGAEIVFGSDEELIVWYEDTSEPPVVRRPDENGLYDFGFGWTWAAVDVPADAIYSARDWMSDWRRESLRDDIVDNVTRALIDRMPILSLTGAQAEYLSEWILSHLSNAIDGMIADINDNAAI